MIQNSTKYLYKSLRSHPRLVRYSRSESQVKRTKSFQRCCNFWSSSLSPQDKVQWSLKAPPPLTGFNYFVKVNILRCFNDLDLLSIPSGEY